MKKTTRFWLLAALLAGSAQAQDLGFNTGTEVYIQAGLTVTVQGGVVNGVGTGGEQGQWFNRGQIDVRDNVTNNATNQMFMDSDPNGPISGGVVRMNGATQTIGGSREIMFDIVRLEGTGTKSLAQNASVEQTLALNDRQLATQNFDMNILSTSSNAITRTSGYVSSTGNGRLFRRMVSGNNYLFPTGSDDANTPFRYRPITLRPSANGTLPDYFGVRMANVTATTEGFDVNALDNTLCEVNPDFFHFIERADANTHGVDITIGYANTDARRETIARWTGSGWTNMAPVNDLGTALRKAPWTNFSQQPYALALNNVQLSFTGPQTTFCMMDDPVVFNFTHSQPGVPLVVGPGITMGPGANQATFNPALAGNGTHILEFQYVGTCSVSPVQIPVVVDNSFCPADILKMPTAFSPNNDGLNDYYGPIGIITGAYTMQVYDRWGRLIADVNQASQGWDGRHTSGDFVPEGVYVYKLVYTAINGTVKEMTGNVTVLH